MAMQQTEKINHPFPGREFVLCHKLCYVIPFLNTISLSKPFCLLRSRFRKVTYDPSIFYVVLVFLAAFVTRVHVKQW